MIRNDEAILHYRLDLKSFKLFLKSNKDLKVACTDSLLQGVIDAQSNHIIFRGNTWSGYAVSSINWIENFHIRDRKRVIDCISRLNYDPHILKDTLYCLGKKYYRVSWAIRKESHTNNLLVIGKLNSDIPISI